MIIELPNSNYYIFVILLKFKDLFGESIYLEKVKFEK